MINCTEVNEASDDIQLRALNRIPNLVKELTKIDKLTFTHLKTLDDLLASTLGPLLQFKLTDQSFVLCYLNRLQDSKLSAFIFKEKLDLAAGFDGLNYNVYINLAKLKAMLDSYEACATFFRPFVGDYNIDTHANIIKLIRLSLTAIEDSYELTHKDRVSSIKKYTDKESKNTPNSAWRYQRNAKVEKCIITMKNINLKKLLSCLEYFKPKEVRRAYQS